MNTFKYLHDFTYPELADQDTPVIDTCGIMWAGKDRRGMNAPNPIDLWKRWQKDVQKNLSECPQRVKEYFHATKFFSKPPKKHEAEELAKNMIHQYPKLEEETKKIIAAATPRFTWSPTKLQQFATCPYQFAATHYYKTLPYQETEATIWGNRVHKAAEDYLLGKGVSDPEAFKPVEKYVKFFEKVPGKRMVEEKISVDPSFKPCEYDAGEGRMIADLAILNGDHLIVADWKTGKVKDDHFQLRTYALLLAIKYPQVQKITYKYIWVKDDVVTGGELLRTELVPVAKDLKRRIEEVRSAWVNENFVARRSGLCQRYCGVTECAHCGGRG